jgi:beta-lactamase class A
MAALAANSILPRQTIAAAQSGSLNSSSLLQDIQRLEAASGGRLGAAILDTSSGELVHHRGNERFPMCSTFKLLAVGAILSRVDAGQESLDRRIEFGPSDLVVNSPVTSKRVHEKALPLADLCDAAITMSDNTAGNLLLGVLGGPSAITSFAQSLGDHSTRLDRVEPALNEALPDDVRDTTTPAAMLKNLHMLTLDKGLSEVSRKRLTAWLLSNKTGDARLRARLPKGWQVADKTGSGERGSTNDVGLIWPPQREPAIVSIYLTGSKASSEERNAAIASVGEAVAKALMR